MPPGWWNTDAGGDVRVRGGWGREGEGQGAWEAHQRGRNDNVTAWLTTVQSSRCSQGWGFRGCVIEAKSHGRRRSMVGWGNQWWVVRGKACAYTLADRFQLLSAAFVGGTSVHLSCRFVKGEISVHLSCRSCSGNKHQVLSSVTVHLW